MKRLADLRKADPAPISGLDALLVNQVFFYDDPMRFTESVNTLCDELEERVKKGEGVFPKDTTRVLMSGCPMAVPNWKVPMLVETSGAVIVGEESCVGERGARWLTDADGRHGRELLENLTDRYFKIDCAVFTPNPSRVDHVKDMFKNTNARASSITVSNSATPILLRAVLPKQNWKRQASPRCVWRPITARKMQDSSKRVSRHLSSGCTKSEISRH